MVSCGAMTRTDSRGDDATALRDSTVRVYVRHLITTLHVDGTVRVLDVSTDCACSKCTPSRPLKKGTVKLTMIMIYFAKAIAKCGSHARRTSSHLVVALAK